MYLVRTSRENMKRVQLSEYIGGLYKHGSGSTEALYFLIVCKSTQELENQCVRCFRVTDLGGNT